jgi:hypothetical protein
MTRNTLSIMLGTLAMALLGILFVASQSSAQPSIQPSTRESLVPPWLTPAQRADFLTHLPPPLNCTTTLQTVVAGPGTRLSECINDDPNIPHPVSPHLGPQAAGLPKFYADGSPAMACPSWGPQGGYATVPEGTKLCPTPPGVLPLTPAQIKGAFTAP